MKPRGRRALHLNPSKRRAQIVAVFADVFAKEARHGEQLHARPSRSVMLASGNAVDLANGIAEPVGERPPSGVDPEYWVREKAEFAVAVAALHQRAHEGVECDVPVPEDWTRESDRRAHLASIRASHPLVAIRAAAERRALEDLAADRSYEKALASLVAACPSPKRPAIAVRPGTLVASAYEQRIGAIRVSLTADGEATVMDRRGVPIPGVTIDDQCRVCRVEPVVAAATPEAPDLAPLFDLARALRAVERLAGGE